MIQWDNMWFEGILINIFSWALTGIFGVALVILGKKYHKLKKTNIDKKILNEILGLIHIYPTRQEAIKDQIKKIMEAQEIRYLSYNGFALLDTPVFLDSSLHTIVSEWKKTDLKQLKVLFLNPKETCVIRKRIERLNLQDIKLTTREIERDQQDIIRNTKAFLEINENFNNINVDIGYFSADLLWCILLYDKYILLSFYQEGITANWARTLLISNTSHLGISITHYFQYLWDKREEINENNLDKLILNGFDEN